MTLNKSSYLVICYMLLFLVSCDREKLTLVDLYPTTKFEIPASSVLTPNVTNISGAVYLPSLDRYYLAGQTQDRTIVTCLLDENNEISEFRTHRDSPNASISKVLAANDGSIYVLGSENSNDGTSSDFLLIRTNLLGEEIWSRKFGTPNCDPLDGGILNSADEVVLVGGTTRLGAPICSIQDDFLVVVDRITGDSIRTTRVDMQAGAGAAGMMHDILETSPGEYLALHNQTGLTGIDENLYLSSSSDLISFEEREEIGVSAFLNLHATILPYRNGVLVLSSALNPERSNSDILVLTATNQGETINSARIESGCDESFRDFLILADGSIVVAGNITERPGQTDMLICKLNVALDVEWCNQYNASSFDSIRKLLQFDDETIKVTGATNLAQPFAAQAVAFDISTIDGSPL